MKLTIVIYLLATTLLTADANEIQSGMILGSGNTEFGVGSHVFYVMYPGIKDAQPGQAKFVIMKTDEHMTTFTPIHTYNVEQGEEAKPYTHFFALRNKTEEQKYYSIKFCKGDDEKDCSEPSSPPTWVDNGKGQLDCKEINEDVKEIDIPAVERYATSEEFQQYKTQRTTSLAAEDSIEKNPSYKEKTVDEGYIYSLLYYPLYKFKAFFTIPEDTKKYCQKKYAFMVLTHLVNKETKMILKRGRFTPRELTATEIETFITNDQPKEVPIEFKLDVKKAEAEKSGLEIWQTVCISAKNMVSTREKGLSTKCSEPMIRDWIMDDSQANVETE